jgi:hypothetical protein
MERLAIDVGQLVCEAVTSLGGTAQASCYNTMTSQAIGYCIFIGLVLLVLFRRFLSQVGGA